MLEVMKVMLTTSSKVDETFEKLLERLKREMEQQQIFASAIHNFQEQLLQDLETTAQTSQNYISTLTTALGSSVQSILKALTFASEDFQINMNDLSHVSSCSEAILQSADMMPQNLKSIGEHSWNINKSVDQIFQQILHGGSELAALRNDELEASRALSLDLRQSLQAIKDNDLGEISTFIHNLHHDLVRLPAF